MLDRHRREEVSAMQSKIVKIVWLLAALVGCFTVLAGCFSCSHLDKTTEKAKQLAMVGADITEVRNEFIKNGYDVSDIVDLTGGGKRLSMSVELKNPSLIDSFVYSSGVDIAPWKKGEKTHLLIDASMDGKITKVEHR